MAKKRESVGQSIGGILVGFDQAIFRSTPPVRELVAKGTPLKAGASAGGTLEVGLPGEDDATQDGPTTDVLRLSAPGVEVVVDLDHGGRVASFVVDGRELLVSDDPNVYFWGSYPMVPYAGRVRQGHFSFRGTDYTLPLGIPPDAIHGSAMLRRWILVAPDTIATDLGPEWPFAGWVAQRFTLEEGRLSILMELHADEPMPASMGWHPWFLRHPKRVGEAADASADSRSELELDLDEHLIYEKDPDGVASRRLVPPPDGWFDQCFTDLSRPPVLRWPGFLELTIGSDCVDWVVYKPEHAICVEPQTRAPDSLNYDEDVVEPGTPLTAEMTWSWRSLAE
jgi:galactose mutarotase-like enzyme